MTIIHARLRVSPDGMISGSAPGAAPGEHDAVLILSRAPRSSLEQADALAAIRTIQADVARLPVLDPAPADEILGYDENGLFR